MTARTTGFLAESSRDAAWPAEQDMTRQAPIDPSKPLRDPILWREWILAGGMIAIAVGAVAFGLKLAGVL